MDVEEVISDRDGRSSDGSTVLQITTLVIQKDVKGFTLAHADRTTGKGCACRKLIIDEVKSISVEEIESQMLDTTNIVTTLDELELAPQTKQFMRWAETGTVEKVFLLPGRPTPARSLFRVTENDQNDYQRNLTSKPTESDDFSPAPEIVIDGNLPHKSAQLEGSDAHTDFANSNRIINGLRKKKIESEDMNCASQIDGHKKAVHIISRPRSRESSKISAQSSPKVQKKIQVISNRIKLMAEKALKKILSLKKNCDKNIREKTREKIECEIFLRTNQCKAIELKLSLYEVDCKAIKDKKDNLTSIEEMIKKLERVVDGMILELQVLWKEAENLAKNLEKAERSYHEIVEELNAVKFPL